MVLWTFFTLLLLFVGLRCGSQLVLSSVFLQLSRKSVKKNRLLTLISLLSLNLPVLFIVFILAARQALNFDFSALMIGTIVGSSFIRIALLVPLIVFFTKSRINKKRMLNFVLGALISLTALLWVARDGSISQVEGLSLIVLYILFFYNFKRNESRLLLKSSIVNKKYLAQKTKRKRHSFLTFFLGLGLMIASSYFLVEEAIKLASLVQLSLATMGIFIFGLGTTLPEFARMLDVKKKSKNEASLLLQALFISNIVGLLAGLGVSAIWVNWRIDRQIATFDIPYLLLLTVITALFALTRNKIDKKESVLLVLLYALYAVLKVLGF